MRLADRIEDRDCTVAVELDLENRRLNTMGLEQRLRESEQSGDLGNYSARLLVRYFALLTAIPSGLLSPVSKLALIAAPVVASYSPTVPPT